MRPVNQQIKDTNQESNSEKEDLGKINKKNRGSGSSEEDATDASSGSLGDINPKILVQSMSRREAFENKAKTEKTFGSKANNRSSEKDLEATYPNLKNLKEKYKTNKNAEFAPKNNSSTESTHNTLSNKSEKNMTANISSKDEVDEFIKSMRDNKNIPCLKLNCNFGGLDKNSYRKTNESEPDASSTANSMQGEILDEKAFQEILNACENVQTLDLSGCRLTDNNCQDLVAYLKKNPALEGIRLGDGDVIKGKNIAKIFRSIEQSSNFKEIVLHDLLIEATDISGSIDAISENTPLESLTFQNVVFTKYTLSIFSVFSLAMNSKIKEISLNGTKVDMRDTRDQNGRLQVGLRIGIRHSAQLQKIDLTDCQLTYAETNELAEVLAQHQGIQELILEGNEVSPATLEKIKATLQRNASPVSTPQSNIPDEARSTGQD